MAFEELKQKQSVIWGSAFEGYRTDDGIHQPRPYLIVLGTGFEPHQSSIQCC